ncbi:MAG TPA: hypothetical protein VK435_06650, partial [Thermodesulfovibrionales bacterium]|nr:hypothetical protein [Thermodesulfovibrionales bacterium]
NIPATLKRVFMKYMDDDLNVGDAFDKLCGTVNKIDLDGLSSGEASDILDTLKDIDSVLRVIC